MGSADELAGLPASSTVEQQHFGMLHCRCHLSTIYMCCAVAVLRTSLLLSSATASAMVILPSPSLQRSTAATHGCGMLQRNALNSSAHGQRTGCSKTAVVYGSTEPKQAAAAVSCRAHLVACNTTSQWKARGPATAHLHADLVKLGTLGSGSLVICAHV